MRIKEPAPPPPRDYWDQPYAKLLVLLVPATFGVPIAGFCLLMTGVAALLPDPLAKPVAYAGLLAPPGWLYGWYFRVHFIDTPVHFFGSAGQRAASFVAGALFAYPFFLVFFSLGPALFLLVSWGGIREHVGWGLASLVFGIVGVYGGAGALWKVAAMRRIGRLLEGLPRSTVHAAAIGPIHLQGSVTATTRHDEPVWLYRHVHEGLPANENRREFSLADETGAMRVTLPADLDLTGDDRLWLRKRTTIRGNYVDCSLLHGDTVTLLGGVVMREDAGLADADEARVTATALPLAVPRYLDWTAGVYRSHFGRSSFVKLGLVPPPAFFFLTDETDPDRIHRELRRRQARALRRATLMLVLSLAYVAAVLREAYLH